MFFRKDLLISEPLKNIIRLETGTELRRVIFNNKEYVIGLLKQGSVVDTIDYETLIHALIEHKEGIISNKKSLSTGVYFFIYDIDNEFILSILGTIDAIPAPTNEIIIKPELRFVSNNIFINNKEEINQAELNIKVFNGFENAIDLPIEYITEVNIDNQHIVYDNSILNIDYTNLINELEDVNGVVNSDQKIINLNCKIVIEEQEYIFNNPIIVNLDYVEKNKQLMKRKDDELVTNMLASVDMFEMLIGMIPVTLSDEMDYTPFMNIINIYVNLINKGEKALDEVPIFLKDKVGELSGEIQKSN